MKPILIVLPSKGRPEKIEGLYDSWRKTTDGKSEVIVALDDDDPMLKRYKRHKDIRFDVGKGKSFADACNRIFKKYSDYKYYFILSDDHRIRTKKWEILFTEAIEKNGGKGVSAGNDLIYGEKRPSSALVSGEIFRSLGFIALPGLIHMFTDNFWLEIGKHLGKFYYFPEIIIEHMHYSVGKSPVDAFYLAVDNKIVYQHDRKIFMDWKKSQMEIDIKKVKSYKE